MSAVVTIIRANHCFTRNSRQTTSAVMKGKRKRVSPIRRFTLLVSSVSKKSFVLRWSIRAHRWLIIFFAHLEKNRREGRGRANRSSSDDDKKRSQIIKSCQRVWVSVSCSFVMIKIDLRKHNKQRGKGRKAREENVLLRTMSKSFGKEHTSEER